MKTLPIIKEIQPPLSPPDIFSFIRRRAYPFFLDSSHDLKDLGRYSFLGSDPYKIITSRGRRIEVSRPGVETRIVFEGDPLEVIANEANRGMTRGLNSPVPFICGGVGFLSYDLLHLVEDIPSSAMDDTGLPECHVAFYDRIIAFDHHEGKCYVISMKNGEGEDDILDILRKGEASLPSSSRVSHGAGTLASNFSRDEYVRAVERAKDYISAGDIYQVNLSQRFVSNISSDPYDLYMRLREVSPAPFSAYMDCGGFQILSASPERFLKVDGREIETRPIKGTRPRGSDDDDDRERLFELRNSGKDRAEHIMIVDLERNDLGRICEYGSVRVSEEMSLESFSHVHHLVSTVKGKLRDEVGLAGILKATFPGGSIIGAPKVRAMEIIEELEPVKRGIYTGAIGYIGFDGRLDLNIAIRTMLVKDSKVYFSVGGGIVADSDPEEEYQETLDKARGMIDALAADPKPAR